MTKGQSIGGDYEHAPVLFAEVSSYMDIKPDGVYVDGTYGRGGHALAILKKLNNKGRLLVMDKDPEAIADAERKLGKDQRVTIIHDDYEQMATHLDSLGLAQLVDGVLLDLGVSSPQLDDASRGFSFQKNGPLDMRMNPEDGDSASSWLMAATEKEIATVLWRLGEEKFSRRIAAKIIEYRKDKPINDTQTLVNIIKECIPAGREKKHPATRSFQAIRIKVNRELEQIESLLLAIFRVVKIGGRILIISFHSLEDRLVKQFFKKQSSMLALPRGLPVRDSDRKSTIRLRLIGKAIKATSDEVAINPRSRSAVLRVAERVC